ncbi:hypothetical protein HOLleu_19842 [Holothuria leucospilota]|uniref:Apple domain-containing protein n=1 Tax=Holothuria leucospilota TaxID=206669 RepID=A0A9Q1C0F9_HOLLE|nr:hypothetical protein HOLleu_19842 [Holothuria leucospilota]
MATSLGCIFFAFYITILLQRCRALNGQWANVAPACTRLHNNVERVSSSVEDCQLLCEQEEDFRCLSVDFSSSTRRCLLSRYNRNSVASTDDFTQPCYTDGWVYSERLDLGFPWSETVLGCIKSNNDREHTVSSMEECQLLCERETSFPCMSVDFRDEQCLLSRYNRESIRPLSDYTQPCYLERYQYSERIDKKYFWTETAHACIRNNNNGRHEDIESFEDCQDLCLQETSFACLSAEYFPDGDDQVCLLSSFNRNSVQPREDFTQPCYTEGGIYSERVNVGQWIPVIEGACISGFNEWSGDVEDFESCKILCSQRSNCCSVDYSRDSKRCLLTSRTRATVEDSDFVTSCGSYSYSERTDVRCVTA